jgi:hypothetical protein
VAAFSPVSRKKKKKVKKKKKNGQVEQIKKQE